MARVCRRQSFGRLLLSLRFRMLLTGLSFFSFSWRTAAPLALAAVGLWRTAQSAEGRTRSGPMAGLLAFAVNAFCSSGRLACVWQDLLPDAAHAPVGFGALSRRGQALPSELPPMHERSRAGMLALCLAISGLAASACASLTTHTPGTPTLVPPWTWQGPSPTLTATITPTLSPLQRLFPPTRRPDQPALTPTPDPTRPVPTIRREAIVYVVRPGDSLNGIAQRFMVGAQAIVSANNLGNPNMLYIGQVLLLPPPVPQPEGPSFKIIPDSELVNGPSGALIDVGEFVRVRGGYLSRYREEVEGRTLTGAQVIQTVAQRYSVNPRLLLALLEFQAGWVTQPEVAPRTLDYPMGFAAAGYEGLFSQLSWAADTLNLGYYRWRAGWAGPFVLLDGSAVPPGPGINAGTAAAQFFFAQLFGADQWRAVVDEPGFFQTFSRLFGNPFDLAIEPLIPHDLQQPPLQLPFEPGAVWSFTGGPHAGWGNGSAWAALDFAPPGDARGCVPSDAWIVAVADGLILRADNGEVVQDLDRDGYEQTGWVILYMHVEARDRVLPGADLRAGDRIGHPSCEGGVSSGTHVHIARRYNGEWIPADGPLPFNLDGWISAGGGWEYDGTLRRGGIVLEACACRNDDNQVSR